MSNASKSDIDQRIRKVAIVLQSLDSGTAKSLLGQLPNDIARQVKMAMVKLGTVTSQERAEAMNGLQELLGASTAKSESKAANAKASRLAGVSVSPADALLALQEEDEFRWSDAVKTNGYDASVAPFSATATGSYGSDSQHLSKDLNSATDPETPWLAWAPSALANFLANERPTVIATVLNQLSPERAKLLLDHLPVETAGATLAALPSLFLVDPSILNDILAEIERKLPKQPPVQTTANIAGIAKLAAIVEQFQGPQRRSWLNAIAQQNEDVAAKLGWTPSDEKFVSRPAAHELPVNQSPTSRAAEPRSGETPDLSRRGQPSDVFISTEVAQDSSEANARQFPVILPIDAYRDSQASNVDTILLGNGVREGGVVNNEQVVALRRFDDLLLLSDGDFVTLLHSCDREIVLRAIVGSSEKMSKRVEGLIPAKDLKKFRAYLKKLPAAYSQAGQSAQATVLEQASQLMEAGRIAPLSGFNFLAAA